MKVTSLLSPESPDAPIPAEKVRTVEIARRNEPVLVAKLAPAARPAPTMPGAPTSAAPLSATPQAATALAEPLEPVFKAQIPATGAPTPAHVPTTVRARAEPPAFRPSQRADTPPAFRPEARTASQPAAPVSDTSVGEPDPVTAFEASPAAALAASPATQEAVTAPGDIAPHIAVESGAHAAVAPSALEDRSGPLTPEDVPVGSPLAWRMVHIDGSLLLDAGAVVPTLADRDFLFEQFEPQCESVIENGSVIPAGKTEDASTPTTISLADMGLMIGSRLGVRSAGAVQATYASRLIGLTPNDFIFITSPTAAAGRLSLDPRDTVEVVAVSSRAVFLFTCSVESVHTSPSPYAILSKPRAIRRLRERRAERIKTRFPVIFSTSTRPNAPLSGLGMANDISDLGMALATTLDIGSVGDWIKVRFYLDMHSSTVCVVADSQIRNVKTSAADADGRVMLEYGLEFAELAAESQSVLRNFVLSHRSMGGS